MVLFSQHKDPAAAIEELRGQGLSDRMIIDELTKQGFSLEQVNSALHSGASEGPPQPAMEAPTEMPAAPAYQVASAVASGEGNEGNIYERIEEITEGIIDEKWDELIVEVRKIVDWKEKVETKQIAMMHDLNKLKEDFTVLHQGVLGKLETYDERMRDVGTELQAVGKVFKDVVPEFVENVKELSRISKKKNR